MVAVEPTARLLVLEVMATPATPVAQTCAEPLLLPRRAARKNHRFIDGWPFKSKVAEPTVVVPTACPVRVNRRIQGRWGTSFEGSPVMVLDRCTCC